MFSKPEEALFYAYQELEISQNIGFKKGIATGYMHVGNYYGNRNESDSALYYFNKAKDYFKVINNTRGVIFINHSLSSVKQTSGDLNEAIAITNETLKLIKEHEDEGELKTKFIGAQHNALANIYIEKGNYKIALIEALKALKCFEDINHKSRKADAIKQIGDIESGLDNHKTAISYFNRAMDIYNELGEKMYLAFTYNSLGISYKELKDYKNAKTAYDLAYKYAMEVEDKLSLSNILHNQAELEIINTNYNKAKQLLIEAETIAKNENLQLSLANAYDGLSQINYYENNFPKSLDYNNQAITLSKINGVLPHLQSLYQYRSELLEGLNRNNEAIFYLKASKKINDSLFSIKKTQQIEELKTIYETEKKEQQIALQSNEIDFLEQKAKINNLLKLLLGGGFTLSLTAIGFGFYGFRQKIKRSRIEKEKLNAELEFKKKELTTHALQLAKKNEVLEDLKSKAKALKAESKSKNGYEQLIHTINFDLKDDKNWESFTQYFEQAYQGFNKKIKLLYPEINTNDLRLIALLKMNLTNKEVASILNISSEGVKKARYRLRKKLVLTTEESLEETILNL